MGILDLFTGRELEDLKIEIAELQRRYTTADDNFTKQAKKLYSLRKQSVKNILIVQSYLENLENCPDDLKKGIDRALSYTDEFREVTNLENDKIQSNILTKQTEKNSDVTTASAIFSSLSFGAIAGASTATATRFALQKVLISSGVRMTAGSMIAFLTGPVAWGITFGSIVGHSLKQRKQKIEEKKKELEEIKKDLNEKIQSLKNRINLLNRLVEETKVLNEKTKLGELSDVEDKNFDAESYPRTDLVKKVNSCKTLGKIINDRILL